MAAYSHIPSASAAFIWSYIQCPLLFRQKSSFPSPQLAPVQYTYTSVSITCKCLTLNVWRIHGGI